MDNTYSVIDINCRFIDNAWQARGAAWKGWGTGLERPCFWSRASAAILWPGVGGGQCRAEALDFSDSASGPPWQFFYLILGRMGDLEYWTGKTQAL